MTGNSLQKGSKRPATRRAVLLAAGQVGALFAVGGLLRLDRRHTAFVRPPGTLGEADFLARCVKCRRCIDVCPQDAVVSVRLAESFAAFDTPRLDFDAGYCDFCMACVVVCPTGALHPVEPEQAALGVAVIDREKCIAWAWGGCTRCFNECPHDAIHLDENQRPIVDEAKCNGCGVCEHVCDRYAKRWDATLSGKGVIVQPRSETV